jgi:hypothetical protein
MATMELLLQLPELTSVGESDKFADEISSPK